MYEHTGEQTSIVSTVGADTATALKEKISGVSSNQLEIFFGWDADSDWDRLSESPYKTPGYGRHYALWRIIYGSRVCKLSAVQQRRSGRLAAESWASVYYQLT